MAPGEGRDAHVLNLPGNAPVLGHPSREAAAPPAQRPDVLLPGLALHLPQLLVVAAQLQQRFDFNLDARTVSVWSESNPAAAVFAEKKLTKRGQGTKWGSCSSDASIEANRRGAVRPCVPGS